MAIQDDKQYSLSGGQVKELAQKIKESGITYSAGTGLELNGTTFSVDNTIATKSEIPTVNNATLTIQKNGASAGTFTANSATDATINITVPVTAADVSALPASTKYAANLSLTIDSSTYVVTGQLKDQDGNNLGSAQTIDLPLESVVVSGSYDSTNKKIILTLQSGQTIDVPVGDLVSGLQTEITSNNKLSADLVDDSTTTNKFVTATDKTTWDGKQNALTAGSNITISGDTISATDTTYSDFVGATSGDAGTHGLVPAPASGETDKYLKSDGSWATVSQYSLPAATASTLGGVKIGTNLSMDANDVLSATDTTYSNFTGTDGTAAGTAGLVPAPATTDAGKVLSASGSWITPDSGIKTLTTADYNYPTNNPTSVALWLLPAGVYKVGSGVPSGVLRASTTSTLASNSNSLIFIAKAMYSGTQERATQILISDLHTFYFYQTNTQTGGNLAAATIASATGLLKGADTQNNLTSTSQYAPLSANQGKVLNDKIEGRIKTNAGAPTTSTTGTKGQLLEDTTNGNLYICTNSASPYAWKQIDKDEILTNAGAPTTSTAGTLGQLLTDTTNAKLYQLTAIDTTDPQNPSYTWSEIGGSSVNAFTTNEWNALWS